MADRPPSGRDGDDPRGILASLRDMPAGIRVFLGYSVLVLGLIAASLRSVVEQAVLIPISPLGVVVMGLLAYTIFTMTLTLQRKEAARPLALGLASLTIPAVLLLLVGGLTIVAAVVVLIAIALFVGLTRPSARAWLNEP